MSLINVKRVILINLYCLTTLLVVLVVVLMVSSKIWWVSNVLRNVIPRRPTRMIRMEIGSVYLVAQLDFSQPMIRNVLIHVQIEPSWIKILRNVFPVLKNVSDAMVHLTYNVVHVRVGISYMIRNVTHFVMTLVSIVMKWLGPVLRNVHQLLKLWS